MLILAIGILSLKQKIPRVADGILDDDANVQQVLISAKELGVGCLGSAKNAVGDIPTDDSAPQIKC